MPPVPKYAWTIRIKLIGSLKATVDCANFQAQRIRPAWSYRDQQWTFSNQTRNLFELHAGRAAALPPADHPLEDVSRPGSYRDEDLRFSTSEQLIDALGPLGQEYVRPSQYARMVDLSFVDPMHAAVDREGAIRQSQQVRELQDRLKDSHLDKKTVLVKYLLHVQSILRYQDRLDDPTLAATQLDLGLQKVFDKETSRWLDLKGLDVTDVMNWTWILTADTGERAALRLTILQNKSFTNQRGARTVPQFVFTFLLHRKSINARALKPLLVYAWKLMKDSETPVSISAGEKSSDPAVDFIPEEVPGVVRDDSKGMSETIFLIIVIRLLRRAREVWPAACESIAALLNQYFDGVNFRNKAYVSTNGYSSNLDQLTYVYNTVLRLLSIPSSMHPFQSAIFQQRAQFSLLRRMNRFNPPLAVDKGGYQAVVRMQLMHKKTLKEREWAHMKARSWPPWKEEKLGMDASIGVEHGISRAREVLDWAEEAGYSTNDWDAAAGILSGWDTDGSPTIQTRSIVRWPVHAPQQTFESRQAAIWAARIRATRTLDEAWSCFLACKDNLKTSATGEPVYHAMFFKVLYDSQRSSNKGKTPTSSNSPNDQALSGDGLEVSAAPKSPREAVYVRQPPPDADALLMMMVQDGIRPSGRLLTLLLTKAWSFDAGIRCLKTSVLIPQHVSALFSDSSTLDSDTQEALESIPQSLFAGFIAFLARFAPSMIDKHGHDRHEMVMTGVIPEIENRMWLQSFLQNGKLATELIRINPIMRAQKLMLARKPTYRPAWLHIFRALASPKAVTGVYSKHASQNYQDVKIWRMIYLLVEQMMNLDIQVDLEIFSIICKGLEKAIFASENRQRTRNEHQSERSERSDADDDLGDDIDCEHTARSKGLPLVKTLFKNVVRSPQLQQEIDISVATETDEESRDEDSGIGLGNGVPHQLNQPDALLPPTCLLPRLLEVPHPAHLHAFIRILGLRRDYDGIIDLIEWMSLFADEINAVADETMNGKRMMRRCITAIRVFLERSWMSIPREGDCDLAGHDGIVIEADPAPPELIHAVHEIVSKNGKWGGWPTMDEVQQYCLKGRFL